MGGNNGHFFTTLAKLLLLALSYPSSSFSISNTSLEATRRRELDGLGIGIGIGIGGGGSPPESQPSGCPPPPPPPSPSPPPPPPPSPKPRNPPPLRRPPPSPRPSPFENDKLRKAYYVIQRFKKTITSDPLKITKTWRGHNPCIYKGFFCDYAPSDKKHTIASVDFNGYKLGAPTIKGFVDKLPDLALFHANSNKFLRTVPDVTSLPFLYELDFSNNRFSGAFPDKVLSLFNLTFLDLRFNSFFGAVLPSVFSLQVDVLFLNNNNFNESIPAELGRSPVLYLTLANNGFTGPIPHSIGNMSNTLLEVLFLNNSLSGCLPHEIGLLKKATVFDAGFNEITGPIPRSFGCLKKVEQLNLAVNRLYGEVPDCVCRLGNLANLSLSHNYFTSIGPSCRMLLKKGVLDVRKNCIPGLPDQRSPMECQRFFPRPKRCPLPTYVPCSLPDEELSSGVVPSRPSLPAAEPERTGDHNRAYTTYSALSHRQAP